MAKRWKKEELTYMKRYAKTRRVDELAERFKTDREAVAEKLAELGLTAVDSVVRIKLEHDPLVKVYEKAVRTLHRGQIKEARKLFEEVAGETDRPELGARARQYLRVCDERDRAGADSQAEDPYLEAVYERNRGDLEAALELCARGGRQSKDDRFAFLAASIHALQGDTENAVKFLELAIEMNPKNRVHAYYDADFKALRGEPRVAELLAVG